RLDRAVAGDDQGPGDQDRAPAPGVRGRTGTGLRRDRFPLGHNAPMRLTILGRSPARPNPGEACAGYLVEGGGSRILMDVGAGVGAQLLRGDTPDELAAVG